MVLKTFNVQQATYEKFSSFCKALGISMSKQVELFMKDFVKNELEAKKEYLERLERIRKEKSIRVGTISDLRARYGIE